MVVAHVKRVVTDLLLTSSPVFAAGEKKLEEIENDAEISGTRSGHHV